MLYKQNNHRKNIFLKAKVKFITKEARRWNPMNFISKQELNSCHCTRSKYMAPTIQSKNIKVLVDHLEKIVARSTYMLQCFARIMEIGHYDRINVHKTRLELTSHHSKRRIHLDTSMKWNANTFRYLQTRALH